MQQDRSFLFNKLLNIILNVATNSVKSVTLYRTEAVKMFGYF